STVAMSRPTSMRVTRKPCRTSASAQALPERKLTSRSADQPPIRTATCLLMLPLRLGRRKNVGWVSRRRNPPLPRQTADYAALIRPTCCAAELIRFATNRIENERFVESFRLLRHPDPLDLPL